MKLAGIIQIMKEDIKVAFMVYKIFDNYARAEEAICNYYDYVEGFTDDEAMQMLYEAGGIRDVYLTGIKALLHEKGYKVKDIKFLIDRHEWDVEIVKEIFGTPAEVPSYFFLKKIKNREFPFTQMAEWVMNNFLTFPYTKEGRFVNVECPFCGTRTFYLEADENEADIALEICPHVYWETGKAFLYSL